jgi:hypothetical protein
MQKRLSILFIISALIVNFLGAQIYTNPAFPTLTDNITVYYDASQGASGLKDCNCDIYVHTGLTANGSTWKYVNTQWGQTNPAWKMTALGNNLYSWTVNINAFYTPNVADNITQLSFVFRNGNGSLEGKASGGKDFFLDLFTANSPFASKLLTPTSGSQLLKTIGEPIAIKGAASKNANLTITDNGTIVKQVSNAKDIEHTITVADLNVHTVIFTAKNGAEETTQTFTYSTVQPVEVKDPPASAKLGATYNPNGSVTFMLYAPGKKNIYVVGDFSNFDTKPENLMKRSQDGNRWWLTIDNWTTGTHTYQYAIDGTLRVADPHSELILDPANDKSIPTASYPNIPAYPAKGEGYVSVMEYPKKKTNWVTFNRPAKSDLVIYELLVRDFSTKRNYQYVLDSLDYLQRLGINAIEFMPVNEYDNNQSWGYNPTFHGALDKYYGSPDKFKELVNECHKRGIAVILDVVFNHISEKSPLIQMYPVSSGAYVNAVAKHDYNVFLDFNHETPNTRAYVDRCLEYWLEEYNIDGYRFDLSKGFTQKNTLGNVGAWGQYDASRIAILKHYNDVIKNTAGDAYHILEHFADQSEEKELVKNGMMVWGNFNYDYTQAAMGFSGGSIGNSYYIKRGFAEPGIVAYSESHDEERMMYKTLNFGNSEGSYSTKELQTALRRAELASVFLFCIPGPKMLWQFQELGYDYSINACSNGTTISNNCRLDIKPSRWDYFDNKDRKRLYEVTASLAKIKKQYAVFQSTDALIFGGGTGKGIYMSGADMDLVAVGNFGLSKQSIITEFTKLGKWYEYFTGDSLTITDTGGPIELEPGEYRLYTTKRLPKPIGGYKPYGLTDNSDIKVSIDFSIFPNPSQADKIELNYALANPGTVKIEIFDMLGRKLEEPVNELQGAGNYGIMLKKLEAGTYFAKLSIDQNMVTKKFVKLR